MRTWGISLVAALALVGCGGEPDASEGPADPTPPAVESIATPTAPPDVAGLRAALEGAADAEEFTVREAALQGDRMRLAVDDRGDPPSSVAHWAAIAMTFMVGQPVTVEVEVNGQRLVCPPESFRSDTVYLERDAQRACQRP